MKAAAKLLNLFLSGSLSYLNPASTFVKIPIKDIKPTLQAFCTQVFPRPLCISSIYCLLLPNRCCAVLYALCVISFSHRFPFCKGKKKGKRANTDRINDDATTDSKGVCLLPTKEKPPVGGGMECGDELTFICDSSSFWTRCCVSAISAGRPCSGHGTRQAAPG